VNESFPTHFPEQLIETAITHNCTKILADLRKVVGTLTTMERFTMGATGAHKYHSALSKGEVSYCRFSLIANPPLMDPHKFGETVATNRGMPVRIFSSYQDAFNWLQQ
jgi:hypothetical protein